MLKQFKKSPSYSDVDTMPFGKFKNIHLQDVPADYLRYLWEQRPISDKKLENYIFNSKEAIELELGKKI